MTLWDSTFGKIPAIVWIKTQIDTLLNGAAASTFDTRNDIRAIDVYSDGDRALCLQNDYIYKFNSAATTADNDDNYLTPANITEPAPGRWVKENAYAYQTHTHTDKADKVTGATEGNFAGLDGDGNLIDLEDKPGNYIAKKPTATAGNIIIFDENGDGVDSGESLDDILESTGGSDTTKMDKLVGVQAGDVGKLLAFDAEGNALDAGYKTVDTEDYDWSSVEFDPDTGISTEAVTDCPCLISHDSNYYYINIGNNYFVRGQIVKTTDLPEGDKPF